MKKKIIISVLVILLIILILYFLILRNIYLGYKKISIIYDKENNSQTVELGIPKLSFMAKENDKSYSFKNLRSNKVLLNEVKDFLKTLESLNCNNTTYYYDSKNDFTIVDYSVKNNFVYNTISYRIVYGNYCNQNKLAEYAKKLGGLKRYHTINGGKITLNESWNSKFEMLFLDDITESNKGYKFKANLKVMYYKRKSEKEFYTYTLENSVGNFQIKDDKLYYTRTEILESSNDITIPNESIFKIKDSKLILTDNYLSNYYDQEIILN